MPGKPFTAGEKKRMKAKKKGGKKAAEKPMHGGKGKATKGPGGFGY